MPLFVPILRLVMLFLNIYDSYKTLKYPPLSSRNPGRPSLRALSQRKRDMKGCLAVWIVWCCFCIYERFVETLISLFIPFYDEIKSLALLFLILTRARGAEPIYLYMIRPFLKPYTSTIDPSLELLRYLGDFLYALTLYPIQLGWSKYRAAFGYPDEPMYGSEADSNSENSFRDENGSVPFPRQSVFLANGNQASVPSGSMAAHTRMSSGNQQHQIWHPPAAAYDDENTPSRPDYPDGLPDAIQSEITVVHAEVEEWRKYPAFPSAYPPTPVITTSRLVASSLKTSSSGEKTLYPSIEEEEPEGSQQDFRKSLLPPRKPLNSSYVGDLSDELMKRSGIHTGSGSTPGSGRSSPSSLDDKPGKREVKHADVDLGLDEEMADSRADDSMTDNDNSEDYTDEDEEEDDFNITLRTPLPPLGSFRSRPLQPMSFSAPAAVFGMERLSSVASALTTGTEGGTEASVESSLSNTDAEDTVEMLPKTPKPSQKGKEKTTRSAVLPSRPLGVSGIGAGGGAGRHKTPLAAKRRRKISTTARKDKLPTSTSTSNPEGEVTSSELDSTSSPSDLNLPKSPTKRRTLVPAVPRQRVISTGGGGARVRPRVTRPASPPPKGRVGTVERSKNAAGNEAADPPEKDGPAVETGKNEAAPTNKNEVASVSATATRDLRPSARARTAPGMSKKSSGSSETSKAGTGTTRAKPARKDTIRTTKPASTTTTK